MITFTIPENRYIFNDWFKYFGGNVEYKKVKFKQINILFIFNSLRSESKICAVYVIQNQRSPPKVKIRQS